MSSDFRGIRRNNNGNTGNTRILDAALLKDRALFLLKLPESNGLYLIIIIKLN